MKIRLLNRLLALAAVTGALALAACDGGNPTATPAPQATPTGALTAPTSQATAPPALPTSGAPSENPSPVPTGPASDATRPSGSGGSGEASSTPAPAEDAPLALSPVVIETTDATRTGAFETERTVNLPPGFHIEIYAAGLSGVRWLGLSPEGTVYATLRKAGEVVRLPDKDGDGVADSVDVFADKLGDVHGIAFKDGAVYVANETQVIRLQDTDQDGKADKQDVIAEDLPAGGGHSSRTIAFGPDGKLYVSAGSSCNVCVEENEKRAAISRYSAEGEFEKVYAKGLRNAVGIIFHPTTGALWATNNGRDGLGDDVPPETLYDVKEDTHYGWPYCYGSRVKDTSEAAPGDAPATFCEGTGVPAVEMQAHSAPLGLAFYTGDQFPAQFKGDMFVAFHGSWNRTVPTGYKLVRVRFADNQPDKNAGDLLVEDFAIGWFDGGGWWGRPVNPMVAPDGSLLVTDDAANAIYRIYYEVNSGP